jgi:RNAse (barnase) inhibitor barstar
MAPWIDLTKELPVGGMRVHVAPSALEPRIMETLRAASFKTFLIEGSRISDKGSFFEESARAFQFPPSFGRNWDAFIDSLSDVGEGLPRIAVVWKDADGALLSDTQAFLDAVLCFDAWADGASAAPEPEDPAQVEVFLLGRAPSFGGKP